jgi:hypothetical protein
VNIIVYQNRKLENVDSREKVDGHQDPPGSKSPLSFNALDISITIMYLGDNTFVNIIWGSTLAHFISTSLIMWVNNLFYKKSHHDFMSCLYRRYTF